MCLFSVTRLFDSQVPDWIFDLYCFKSDGRYETACVSTETVRLRCTHRSHGELQTSRNKILKTLWFPVHGDDCSIISLQPHTFPRASLPSQLGHYLTVILLWSNVSCWSFCALVILRNHKGKYREGCDWAHQDERKNTGQTGAEGMCSGSAFQIWANTGSPVRDLTQQESQDKAFHCWSVRVQGRKKERNRNIDSHQSELFQLCLKQTRIKSLWWEDDLKTAKNVHYLLPFMLLSSSSNGTQLKSNTGSLHWQYLISVSVIKYVLGLLLQTDVLLLLITPIKIRASSHVHHYNVLFKVFKNNTL